MSSSRAPRNLYSAKDPVTILDDASFIGEDCRIQHGRDGILKVYAPWCVHCQGKIKCINSLAEILPEYGLTVYVINAEDNSIFREHFKIQGFPTFLRVKKGKIGDVLRNKAGEQVYTVPDIIAALCGNDPRICKYTRSMEDCT
jgi:thiol-disulfide isomerase/thioredoxin